MNYLGIDFQWELTLREKKIIKYLVENGFKIIKNKQYMSKMKLEIEKDNIRMKYEIPCDVSNMNSYIKMFERNWELTKKIKEMEEQKNAK